MTSRLAASLRQSGARCSRVLLNGGDAYDWGPRHAHVYRGPLSDWADWLRSTIRRERVTDLILYGDANPYCAAALRVADDLSLKAQVMEQGYFRPFWITLEPGGVNGNSGLPRDPEIYRRAAQQAETPAEVWLPPLTPPAIMRLSAYHAALWLTTPLFPRFRLHYEYSLSRQVIGHVRRYIGHRLFAARHRRRLAVALDTDGPIFVGVLQRPGDSQLRLHSPFPRMAEFIEHTVRSFSTHAPAGSRLIFKAHPLDHGVERHERTVKAVAERFGVAERVFFIDRAKLTDMLPLAAGVVTINSTTGLAAIEAGRPTVVLGKAIYDMPGLTHQHGLDRFWTSPAAPDQDLFQAFRKVVIARTQISGAYATRRGVEMIVPSATRRLLEDGRSAGSAFEVQFQSRTSETAQTSPMAAE